MADNGALRARRARAHKAGDHSLCRRGCSRQPAELVAAQPAADVDPRAELQALAGRMIAAHCAEPGNAMLGRELRMVLAEIARAEKPDTDVMGELRGMAARIS